MSTIIHPTFLRALLRLDAATCLLSGLALLFIERPLRLLTGMSGEVAGLAAVILLVFGLYIATLAVRGRSPAWAVWIVVAVNMVWCIASLEYLLMRVDPLTAIGQAIVVGQAVAVLALGVLEGKALRGSMRPAMA